MQGISGISGGGGGGGGQQQSPWDPSGFGDVNCSPGNMWDPSGFGSVCDGSPGSAPDPFDTEGGGGDKYDPGAED